MTLSNNCLSSAAVAVRKLLAAGVSFLVLTTLVACIGSQEELATLEENTISQEIAPLEEIDTLEENIPLVEVATINVPQPEQPVYGPATVGDITDLILVTGQSNALGAGTSFDWNLDAPSNRVMAFTDNGWQVANLNQVWDLGWFPRNDPNTDPSNNFSLHFGKQLAERRPDRVTGIILVSAPGEAISHWSEGGAFIEEIRTKVSRAINELPYKSTLSAILWHQGESDGEDRIEYSVALYDLIQRFRSEPWFGYGYPFICGETASSPVNRQLQKLNTDNDPWTACIAAEGLPTVGDDSHFSAPALRTIGKRYADTYIEMLLAD